MAMLTLRMPAAPSPWIARMQVNMTSEDDSATASDEAVKTTSPPI
jgi:hypothetical protein